MKTNYQRLKDKIETLEELAHDFTVSKKFEALNEVNIRKAEYCRLLNELTLEQAGSVSLTEKEINTATSATFAALYAKDGSYEHTEH